MDPNLDALLRPCGGATKQKQQSPESPDGGLVEVEALELLAGVLDVLLGLHAHVEDGAVLATADDLAVHAALASLTLCP